MKDKGLLRYLATLFRGRARKFWVAMVVLLMAGTATAAVMAWEHPSMIGVETSHANVSFKTTVTGITTDSNQTPLLVDGHYYNQANISGFSYVSYGNGRIPSSLMLNIGNILPGDYAEFQVTIANTGSTTLEFSNYTMTDAAYNSTTGAYVPPSENVTGLMNATGSPLVAIAPYTYSTNFGNLTGYTAQDFYALLDGHSYWAFNWGSTTLKIPSELKNGQSFTYDIFVGLGTTAPYPPTNAEFTMSIPLAPVR